MRNRRLHTIVAVGLFDSFWLALGWTLFVLYAATEQGLAAVGLYGAAMLLGVALSAPAAGWASSRLDGRSLLRSAAAGEAALRLSTFAALLMGAPPPAVACLVLATNVLAWTAYAGMRAEVAAVDSSAGAMTAYVVAVAAVEAVGVAAGALLPADAAAGAVSVMFLGLVAVYGTSTLPTLIVAAGSRVPRATRVAGGTHARRNARPLTAGLSIMALASGPTLLSAALAQQLYGREAVVVAALAFAAGALLAPKLATRLARGAQRPALTWSALGIGMVIGWLVAPAHVAGLVLAQALSGLSMSAFEGTMDVRVVARSDEGDITATLAWAGSARALGSALAVGVTPLAIAGASLAAVAATLAIAVAAGGIAVTMLSASRGGVSWSPLRAVVPGAQTLTYRTAISA